MTANPFPFQRELLPPAGDFYRRAFRRLSRPNRSGWAVALCPFHRDRHPSLSVNVRSGAFNCFSCGAHGGDVIDFVMQRDGLNFKSAAIALGAWERGATVNGDVRAEIVRRQQRRAARDMTVDRLLAAERSLRLQYRSEVHLLESSQRKTAERLRSPAITPQERNDCLGCLQVLLPEIREALAAYYLLAFASIAERVDFITHPDTRDAAIQSVLERGFIRDDAGRVYEVVLP